MKRATRKDPRPIRFIVPAVALVFLAATAARADDVTFAFQGEVIGGSPGEKITGTYTFDGDASSGVKSIASATYPLGAVSLTHAGTDYEFKGGTIKVTDPPSFFFSITPDEYRVVSSGVNATGFELLLSDPTNEAISGLDLPVTPPDLDDFPVSSTQLNYLRLDRGNGSVVFARLTSLAFDTGAATIAVDLDVKPGSAKNPLNPKSRGKVPVALLGSADFDVRSVSPGTVELTGDGTSTASPVRWKLKDVDDDGVTDLLLHFAMADLAGSLDTDTVSVTLTGETVDGDAIAGSDAVSIVPRKK